jgi:hypothetical protein
MSRVTWDVTFAQGAAGLLKTSIFTILAQNLSEGNNAKIATNTVLNNGAHDYTVFSLVTCMSRYMLGQCGATTTGPIAKI